MAQELEYKVVVTGAAPSLEKEVNAALSQGWKLYGPLTATERSFVQALVRGRTAGSVHDSRGSLTL